MPASAVLYLGTTAEQVGEQKFNTWISRLH